MQQEGFGCKVPVSTKPPDNQVTECGGDIYRCEKCGDEKPGFAWRLMLQVICRYQSFGIGKSPMETFYRRNNFEYIMKTCVTIFGTDERG